MEALPFSRRALAVMGIQVSPHLSPWTRCWNYIARTGGILTMSALILLPIYSLVFQDVVLVVFASLSSAYTIKLTTYLRMVSMTGNLFPLLINHSKKLDEQTITKIKQYDCRHGSAKVIFVVILFVLVTVSLVVNGIGVEVPALLMGLRTDTDTDGTFVCFPLFLFFISIIMYGLLIQFYITTLFFCLQVANKVRDYSVQASSSMAPSYGSIKKKLGSFNKLMAFVNAETGSIPFGLIGHEFIVFAGGISFLVTSSGDLKLTLYFAGLAVGAVNLLYLLSLFQVIGLATQIQTIMTEAWQIAEECASNPHTVDISGEPTKMRESLKYYLSNEKVVPVTAYEIIVIDRSLVLKFFNQVIPFTVMMFTTVKELERKTSKQKISH